MKTVRKKNFIALQMRPITIGYPEELACPPVGNICSQCNHDFFCIKSAIVVGIVSDRNRHRPDIAAGAAIGYIAQI